MIAEIARTFRMLDAFRGIFPIAIICIFHVVVVVIEVIIDLAFAIAAAIGTYRGAVFPSAVDAMGNRVTAAPLLSR